MNHDAPWVLIGMMGSGKSTIGKMLAERTGREFLDTDVLITQRLGRSIEKIFEFYGEPTFRDHETSIIRGLPSGKVVVSTGGGAFVRPENRDHLKALGTTIYLRVAEQTLIQRLEVSRRKRPLLASDDWKERLSALLAEREKSYTQAEMVIEIGDETLEESVALIMQRLGYV